MSSISNFIYLIPMELLEEMHPIIRSKPHSNTIFFYNKIKETHFYCISQTQKKMVRKI